MKSPWRCLCIGLLLTLSAQVAKADLYVIVNTDNSVAQLSEEQVERLFLLKAKRFDNGNGAEPVSQTEASKARSVFNDKVLKRNEQQLKYYWSRKMFSGSDKPPPVVGGDADVESFVAEKTGGIGYMMVAPVNARVKVVLKIKN